MTPIYITKLEINNIRTFGKTCLNFETEDGILPQWTLILGDNGIGKSTLLQSISWMKPFLPYKKDEMPDDFIPAPIINDEENDVLRGLVSKVSKKYHEGAYIKGLFTAGQNLGNKKNKKVKYCKTAMTIKLNDDSELIEVTPELEIDGETFHNEEVLIYAYSASRTLGKGNLEDGDLQDTLKSFILDQTILYDAQELLHTINYARLGSDKKEREKYSNFFKFVKEMLISLLPDFEKVSDIKITAPKLVDNKLRTAEFLITTKHGKSIPFEDFSLGYKTVLSWSIDLAWRLFNKYSNSANPLAEPAIVIIDEIDLHLHPEWQSQIINNISKHFPNVQFIATAHSPLMVQSKINANFAVIKFVKDHVEIVNEPGNIDGWRVDQILTSIYFGLDSARGPEYSQLLKRRNFLASKEKLSKNENKEYHEIVKRLSEFPTGDTTEQNEDRKLIREAIDNYKKTGKKIVI